MIFLACCYYYYLILYVLLFSITIDIIDFKIDKFKCINHAIGTITPITKYSHPLYLISRLCTLASSVTPKCLQAFQLAKMWFYVISVKTQRYTKRVI